MAKDATIIRVAHRKDNPYFMVTREAMQDERISFEARGVLGYLLSKPDDWAIRIADLMRSGKIGRDKTYRILKELIGAGYVKREQQQFHNGRWSTAVYYVFETPHQPLPENPYTENTDTLQNTESIQNNSHRTTAQRLRVVTRRKRAKAAQQKKWLLMCEADLQQELTKWRNFARAKPNVPYFQDGVLYLERLCS